MSRRDALVSARRVSRSFGEREALRPTDLEVRSGEVLALVGANGAGKSTLLSLLSGSLEPTSGSVQWAAGVGSGWVPQRLSHYGRLTPRENLELFARLEGEPRPAAAAGRLLESWGLPDDRRASDTLSLGNRQRLNVALALLGRPQVLLLDEPTASLDPRARREFWSLVLAQTAGDGAVVFATQNFEELSLAAHRVVALEDGAVVFDGTVEGYERSRAAAALA